MEEDERLRPILLNVEKQYVGKDYGRTDAVAGKVRPGDVDGVSISATAKFCGDISHCYYY